MPNVNMQVPNDAKLRELILYVSRKLEGDETFRAVKLNKVLFYADFMAYLRTGCSITGQEYQALPQGPAPRRLIPIRTELENSDRAIIKIVKYYGKDQQKCITLDDPDLSIFTAEEISLVDKVIEGLWDANATMISNLSHHFIGWQLADEGETIPYSVALVGNRDLTIGERKRGHKLEELAQRYIKH